MGSKSLLQFTSLPKKVNGKNCQKKKVLTEKGQLWCKPNAIKLWSGSNEAQVVTSCNFILQTQNQQLILN